MPRRKTNERAGPVKTRSREGCSQCRASRVRCDTKKPVCTRCQEKGLLCLTNLVLKWESEFASRGQAFGRTGVWSKSNATKKELSTPSPPGSNSFSLDEQDWCLIPRVESWNFVNSSVDAFELPYLVKVSDDDLTGVVSSPSRYSWGLSFSQLAKPMAPLSLFPQLTGTDQGHLFEYYVQQVCPRMIAGTNLPSPFASIIIPFSSTASSTSLQAIQALGACTWARVNPAYRVVGLRLKSEAIRGLRNSLAAVETSVSSFNSEILVVMMLLCLYELADHCDQRWTIHLKGAKELIRLRRQLAQPAALLAPQNDEVASFAEQFFAFQDVMGRTACGEKPLFGTDCWRHDQHKVDPWMGCSPQLVSILSEITGLSRTKRQLASDSDQATFSLKTATLCHQLEDLVQDLDYGDGDLAAIAELKRLAAIIYLHCTLYDSSPSTSLVARYVRKILRHVSNMLDTGSLIGLAWPVFVAAVELDPLDDELWKDVNGRGVYGRPLVLRVLATMSESTIMSVDRTRAVIEKVWQARDNDTLKIHSRPYRDPFADSDWETYVAPFSMAMSLA